MATARSGLVAAVAATVPALVLTSVQGGEAMAEHVAMRGRASAAPSASLPFFIVLVIGALTIFLFVGVVFCLCRRCNFKHVEDEGPFLPSEGTPDVEAARREEEQRWAIERADRHEALARRNCSPIFRGAALPQGMVETFLAPDFSLARHALDRWDESSICVKTCGPNLQGDLETFTYGELKAASRAAANVLVEHGLVRGSKVLLLQWNSWQCCVAYWGVHCIGAVAVMAVPMHVERKYLLKYTGCRAVVAPCSILPQLRTEIDDRTHVRLLLLTDPPSDSLPPAELADRPRAACSVDPSALDDKFPEIGRDVYATKLFLAEERAATLSQAAAEQQSGIGRLDECLWYFTSGTTGKPKGCTHRQIDLAFAAETYGRDCMQCKMGDLTATDVLMAGPYAMGSNMIFPMCVGAAVFLDHEDKLNPAPADCPMAERILIKAMPSIFVSIPGSIEAISKRLMTGNQALADALQKCRVITSAGAPLPPSTYLNFRHAAKTAKLSGCEVLDGIGTSELQHIFISNHVGNVRSGEGSVGTTCLGYEAKLLNATSSTDGWEGELMIRTQVKDIFVKYSAEFQPQGADFDAATDEVLMQDQADSGGSKWYITGDRAKVKNVGGINYFFLLGRTKDLASQINEGADRGLGVEDFENKRTADAVLCAAGLYESRAAVAAACGTGCGGEVLVASVYPVKVLHRAVEHCVFVCGVMPSHWGQESVPREDALEGWAKYIGNCTEGRAKLLVFTPAGSIPRTPPPLLKPKVGVIKSAVQAWVDRTQPTTFTWSECLQLSRELRFD